MQLKNLRWWVIALIALATVINYIDRSALSVLWPDIVEDLFPDESALERKQIYANISMVFILSYAFGQAIFLGFQFEGIIYQSMGLPFGSKASPSIFCRIMNLLWAYLCSLRILCFWYMNDSIIIGKTAEEASKMTKLLCKILKWAGVKINNAKSVLEPKRVLDYIGIVFDLDAWTFSVRDKTIQKIVTLCEATIVAKRV